MVASDDLYGEQVSTKMRRSALVVATLVMLNCMLWATIAHGKLFVSDNEPWAMWSVSDEACVVTLDHDDWQQFLDHYLLTDYADGTNRVDYAAVSDNDQARLQVYLDRMSLTDPRQYPLAEQQAYWINLYNALTVATVLQHYPVDSIRRIYGGLLKSGPWDETLIEVAGQALTLNDIEHRILRPIWRDPRIHYALNCASLGCPNLAADVYTAANTNALLNAAARGFVNSERGVSMQGGKLELSSIYDWYDQDFGANRSELLEHLQEYAAPALGQQLAGYQGRIRYDYDWRLNDR
jgi:hypothetical protein